MADDLLVPGERRPGRQVVELPDQPRHPPQALVRTDLSGLDRLPGRVAVHEAQDLPSPLVHPEEPGSPAPAGPFEITEKLVDEPRPPHRPAPHRVPYLDDTVNGPT